MAEEKEMHVEIGQASAPATPASTNVSYVTEHVASLMVMGGIEAISATRYTCGFGTRLHVTIAPFADAPDEIKAQGVVIKDALAAILSIANVARLVISPGDNQLSMFKEMWKSAVAASKAANGGSAQSFPKGSDADSAIDMEPAGRKAQDGDRPNPDGESEAEDKK